MNLSSRKLRVFPAVIPEIALAIIRDPEANLHQSLTSLSHHVKLLRHGHWVGQKELKNGTRRQTGRQS